MSKVNVNGKVFNVPDTGREPNWSSDLVKWIREVSTVLESFFGLGTITETQSILENNISVAKNVAGLTFNPTLTKTATIEYRIYRKTDSSSELSEKGVMTVFYSEVDPLNKWRLVRELTSGGPALIYFDIDNAGQIKYTSSNLTGSNYDGYVRFKTANIMK